MKITAAKYPKLSQCPKTLRFARPSGRLTQHKMFVSYDTHLNFCETKTSFMLETLDEIEKKGVL